MPERNLGVAVFCNSGGAPIPDILINYVLDRLCGKEPVPWLDRLRDLRRKALAQFCVVDGFQGKRDGFFKGGNALGLSWGRFRIELGIHSKFQGKHYPSPRSLMQAFENLRLQMM